ncbi:MAG: YgiQ family radical SAM protein [Peptococcaceae bacterium]|nr:YgiQ family radical SAM protein [Peptococcaceae bacterium]
MNQDDLAQRGWEEIDFLLVTGDAYVDHPSFGTALIGRWLEYLGYRVGMIAQPDWKSDADFLALGVPKYGIITAAGNMDSMVNHYTAAKKRRKQDAYSPGGKAGLRPDRATIVYSKKLRQLFPDKPIILGGIEASLRRFVHYDYWEDKLFPPMLFAAEADLLSFGMSEIALKEVCAILAAGGSVADCHSVAGMCYLTKREQVPENALFLPSFAEIIKEKKKFAVAFQIEDREQNFYDGRPLVQAMEKDSAMVMVQNRPARPLTTEEMDLIYELPYERRWHPRYDKAGGIPAFKEVAFSIVSHRGCFGGCSFCALNFHQGRLIQSRSDASILREAELLTRHPDFKGYIHDVGGPTANFRNQVCKKCEKLGPCRDKQCLYPRPCKSLPYDHSGYTKLLTALRKLPGVKKVFVRSGLRFDYCLADKSNEFLPNLCRFHVSGQLKVAPEHVADNALSAMGKPKNRVYNEFVARYRKINGQIHKEQYLIPYFMAAHPGCTLADSIQLAEYIRNLGHRPEQVQEFMPTPGSCSTAMFYSGYDPRTMEPIFVPRSDKEKAMQRALLQYWNKENWPLIREALRLAKREDLIGLDRKALVPPEGGEGEYLSINRNYNPMKKDVSAEKLKGKGGRDSRSGKQVRSSGKNNFSQSQGNHDKLKKKNSSRAPGSEQNQPMTSKAKKKRGWAVAKKKK